MVRKLTWRQTEVLLSIYLRMKNFGCVSAGDIVSDSGVSINTVGNHLEALQRRGMISQPDGKNVKNLNFHEKLNLTADGISYSEYQLSQINATAKEPITSVYEKNRSYYKKQSNWTGLGYNLNSNSPFSRVFREIIEENKTEPVITSMAMYSELDSQLALFSETDKKMYSYFSKSRLHMEIRSGRIASIAIPISLRGNISQTDLFKILGDGWSWPGIANVKSLYRYLGESLSLGIAQKQGNVLTSLKPTTTDTITWLASKVNSAFQNIIYADPKAALVVFRETFRYPTLEELMDPRDSDSDWLNKIYDKISDKRDYRNVINSGVELLFKQAKIVDLYENHLMPRTVIRKIKSIPAIEERFGFYMKESKGGNLAASILLAITARPCITMSELCDEINKNNQSELSERESYRAVTTLSNIGLVHVSRSYLPAGSPLRLHAITQIPYLADESLESTEANAIIKGLQPSMLSTVSELFPEIEERGYLYNVINKLSEEKRINLDEIETEYSKPFARKVTSLSNTAFRPFMRPDSTFTNLELLDSNLAEVVFNVVQYSMLTNDRSLDIYSQTLSDMIIRDKKYSKTVESDALDLKNKLLSEDLKNN